MKYTLNVKSSAGADLRFPHPNEESALTHLRKLANHYVEEGGRLGNTRGESIVVASLGGERFDLSIERRAA